MEVVAEEGKPDWRLAMKGVPGVRCRVMECKGDVDGLVECGLHG